MTDSNFGIPSPDAIRDYLTETESELSQRQQALLAAAARVPAIIDDADTAGRAGDFIKQLTGHAKKLDTARISSKEGFLEGGRSVDGWFKNLSQPLLETKKEVENRLNVHLRAVAAAEKERRLQEERLAREAEAEARRVAEEAAERITTEEDMVTAIAAADEAQTAVSDALAAQQEANAKAADMSRVTGEYGSVASLRTTWEFEVTDFDTLDLETLRPFLHPTDVEKAVRGYVKSGGRSLAGASIFEQTKTVVR
jgi:hypothetical protein